MVLKLCGTSFVINDKVATELTYNSLQITH